MKKNKWYTISVFIIICVLLNLAGKCIAGYFRLPLWLDSLGTVAATYVCGPVCGVIVGVTLNILYSIIYSWTYACYAIVSVSIAVVAGICISKDYMKTLLGALTSSFYIALVSCSISVIFNYMFFNGYTNNIWGDGVIESLLGIGFNDLLSHVAGQFYIDFPDKIITVLALYMFVRYDKGKNRFDKRIMTACIYIGIAAMAAVQLIEVNTPKCVYAAFDNSRNNQNNIEETPDYNTYLQTVYGRENGIPGGCANDIAQTNDGILWIGTYGGLYRYNGTEFKWVDEYASVKTVNCLYKDEEGRLWIGTNDGGVSIMIDETIINVVSEKEGLSADSVKCITQGSDGDYYIGTTGAMSIVSLADGLTVKSYIDDIKYAVSADSDKNGNIAVVSDNGQLSIVKNAAVISEYSASDGGRYTTCSFDDAGMLYVGTSKGNIDKYNINNNAYVLTESISCNEFNNIKEIYFVDLTNYRTYNYTKEEFVITGYQSGESIRYDFYSKDCPSQVLASIRLNLPSYNSYYKDEVCKGVESYSLCQKWSSHNLSYEKFLERVTNYKNSLISEPEPLPEPTVNELSITQIIINFLLDYYVIILIVLILGLVGVYMLSKKDDVYS